MTKQTSRKLTLRQRFERWLGNLIWGPVEDEVKRVQTKMKTTDLMKDFEDMKKHLISEFGEKEGKKLYVQLLADCAKGKTYTLDDNLVANRKAN